MRRWRAVVLLIGLIGAGCTPHQPVTIRVLSYNIHHGEGMDGVVDLPRIAGVIRASRADLVALQEVDRGVARTAGLDEPAELAELTGMHVIFEKNIDYQGGDYGNALLSRYPIVAHQNHHFPQTRPGEQRGALAAEVRIGRRLVLFVATHLDYHPDDTERLASVALLRELAESNLHTALIIAGDFNDPPDSAVLKNAGEFLLDVWTACEPDDPGLTYPAEKPDKRIDYMLVDRRHHWACRSAQVLDEAVASDHRPLLAELELPR